LYKFKYASIVQAIIDHPPLMTAFLFLALWLVVAAAVPLLLSIGGWIAGLIRGVRRK
jgi:hypothetical protein